MLFMILGMLKWELSSYWRLLWSFVLHTCINMTLTLLMLSELTFGMFPIVKSLWCKCRLRSTGASSNSIQAIETENFITCNAKWKPSMIFKPYFKETTNLLPLFSFRTAKIHKWRLVWRITLATTALWGTRNTWWKRPTCTIKMYEWIQVYF